MRVLFRRQWVVDERGRRVSRWVRVCYWNVPSVARVAAGDFGFLTLIQVLDGPER
jgi:hypothetical protein